MPGVAELAPLKIEAPPEFRRKIKIRAVEKKLAAEDRVEKQER